MFSFLRRKKNVEETSEQHIDQNRIEDNQVEEIQQPLQETPQPDEELPSVKDGGQTGSDTSLEPKNEDVEQSTTVNDSEVSLETPEEQKTLEIEVVSEKVETNPIAEEQEKQSFFTRLKKGLSKTRQSFTESLASLVLGRKEIDDDLLDDLEMILLTADVGIDATDKIIKNLTEQVSRKELKDPEALITALKLQLQAIIDPMSSPLEIDTHLAKEQGPFVILMVGINGVGKTTTIGKLAKKYQLEGKSVMLAAGDTFRAAAVEQLQTWGERNNVPVMAQKTGADSAAVIFDAIQSAKAKKIDVLIADTAGRLHTQSNLMEELKKVKRVIAKVDDTAPHEVMLVIDAGTGQNALNQAQQFQEAVDVSGITLTKLDGTAKGGIVFALAEQRQIPIRFIGVGESIDDLRTFNSKSFTEALFDQSNNS
ncbi:signal recognition particle-docking protein FtsY [Thiomicrorhabdus lithotrophica]|uniref:Signal recognition particle receptor FtsY n=1 Tax=Thiomicrorhabdus lithotrophica TaxID=2949997 RepID=A0ABY8CE53_9GAMM|nr:signal recognition particle-docking protein FtsY [Thiomicrorhabdus lithotrophica]WEJ62418.1 signal recognition particle-docking protein FtsY [Thiomicrorhabdus lithotrophica]